MFKWRCFLSDFTLMFNLNLWLLLMLTYLIFSNVSLNFQLCVTVFTWLGIYKPSEVNGSCRKRWHKCGQQQQCCRASYRDSPGSPWAQLTGAHLQRTHKASGEKASGAVKPTAAAAGTTSLKEGGKKRTQNFFLVALAAKLSVENLL